MRCTNNQLRQLLIILMWAVLISPQTLAQDQRVGSTDITPTDLTKILANSAADAPIDTSNFKNTIQVLNNRFRIDHTIEAVTMVFFREYGSAPIVLVRPDGSKIFQYNAARQGVNWFDAVNYDMITIENPMQGPWQAVGQIMDNSTVMVLSDIELVTEPIPDVLYVGESFRIRAQLLNAGQPMTFAPFSEALQMTIDFASANISNENNFGARQRTVAFFTDDGIGLDEKPKDAIFTGEFSLDIPYGTWHAIARVVTPMYTRESIFENIRVVDNPVSIKARPFIGEVGEGSHTMTISLDAKEFDIATVIVDAIIRYPNGEALPVSLSEKTIRPRVIEIPHQAEGVYSITGTVFARTLAGRNVRLNIPSFNFVVEPFFVDETPLTPEQIALLEQAEQERLAQLKAEQEAKMIKGAVIINVTVLILGLAVMFIVKWWMHRRNKALKAMAEGLIDEAELVVDGPAPWYQQWLAKLPFKKAPKEDVAAPSQEGA